MFPARARKTVFDDNHVSDLCACGTISLEQFVVDHDTAADARSERHEHAVAVYLPCAERRFAERRRIGVVGNSDGKIDFFFHHLRQRHVLKLQICGKDDDAVFTVDNPGQPIPTPNGL